MTEENTNGNGSSEEKPAPAASGDLQADEKTMGMLAHLLGIVTCFIGPLIIWLVKKDQSEFINDQGKEALNWQITLIGGWVVTMIVSFIPILGLVGCILGPAIFVLNLVFCILGGLAANKGERYRYPVALRLIK